MTAYPLAPHRLAGARMPALPLARDESPLLTAALAIYTIGVMTISSFALAMLGFDYSDAGGNVLTKFHPTTLYLGVVPLLTAAGTGNPLGALVYWLKETPAALAMGTAATLAVAHAGLITKIPVTAVIETFVPPAMLLLLLAKLPEQRGQTLARLIHVIMLANATLAIGEYLTGWRLTPFVIDGENLNYEWRASALLGHPLANAMITGTYLVILGCGGGRDLSAPVRIAAFTANFAAMTAFGGRGALVLLLVVLALLAGRKALAVLNGARLDTRVMMGSILALPAGLAAVLYLAHSNFFDKLLDRFANDTGSSQTRLDMLELFSHIPLKDLIFAPDPRQVATWQTNFGLERGIESFWLSMALSYGLVVSFLIFAALFPHCWTIVRRCKPGAALPLVYFIATATTSLSLAGKSSVLSIVTLLVLVLMRPVPLPRLSLNRLYSARLR